MTDDPVVHPAVADGATDVIVIGAGLAGLVAAERLATADRHVLVIDKGRSVGGRLATRRIGNAVLDHGAQFFTVRSDEFRAAVDAWISAGVVEEWCRGFGDDDGYPRYRTAGGMNALAKHLAAGLPASVEVRTGHRAAAVIPVGDGLAVSYDGDLRPPDEARAVITTAPVPQTIDLLRAGGVRLGDDTAGLADLRYHSVIALLATVDRPLDLGPHGARQTPEDPVVTFAADNGAKGISPTPALTAHLAHDLSSRLWDADDAAVLAAVEEALAELLGDARVETMQVKRWRYAGPVEPWPNRCAVIDAAGGSVVVAGDAFGGPKVEGAFLSGLAAADAVLDALG